MIQYKNIKKFYQCKRVSSMSTRSIFQQKRGVLLSYDLENQRERSQYHGRKLQSQIIHLIDSFRLLSEHAYYADIYDKYSTVYRQFFIFFNK
jgi:hypothetical protein